jgi:hypothetical protein
VGKSGPPVLGMGRAQSTVLEHRHPERSLTETVTDPASVSIGAAAGVLAAFLACRALRLTDGTVLDALGAAVIAIVVAGIVDYQARGTLTRFVAAAAGSGVGAAISFVLGAVLATAGTPILGWEISGAVAVFVGSAIALALALRDAKGAVHLLDMATQAGAIFGTAIGLAVCGAFGGLLLVSYLGWTGSNVGADAHVQIGIALGSALGGAFGLILGMLAGYVAAMITLLTAPGPAVRRLGPRNAAIAVAVLTGGVGSVTLVVGLASWWIASFLAFTACDLVLPAPLPEILSGVTGLVVGVVVMFWCGITVVSQLGVKFFLSDRLKGLLWGGQELRLDEGLRRLGFVEALMSRAEPTNDESSAGSARFLLLLGGGLVLATDVALWIAGGASGWYVVGPVALLFSLALLGGMVVAYRTLPEPPDNPENTRSPVFAVLYHSFGRTVATWGGNVMAGLSGLLGAALFGMGMHVQDESQLLIRAVLTICVGVLGGVLLTGPTVAAVTKGCEWIADSSLERRVTRRPDIRRIGPDEASVRDVWESYLRHRFGAAVDLAGRIDLRQLSVIQLRELAVVSWLCVQGIDHEHPSHQAGCRVVGNAAANIRLVSAGHPTVRTAEAGPANCTTAAVEIDWILEEAFPRQSESGDEIVHFGRFVHRALEWDRLHNRGVDALEACGWPLSDIPPIFEPLVSVTLTRTGRSIGVSVRTYGGLDCDLNVIWPSGRASQASAAHVARATDARGFAHWQVAVAPATQTGIGTVVVKCAGRGVSYSGSAPFRVARRRPVRRPGRGV